MGLFGLPRKEKETWASIVINGIKPGMQIDDAQDYFMIMNEHYKHPERIRNQEKHKLKRQKRDSFWEAYGTMEILDDIFDDHNKN